MDKNISYLARNYNDYQNEFKKLTQKYYPEMSESFNDAQVGQWFIDLFSALGDELSYHIDKSFQETNINSAQLRSSVYDMARNNGFKIPGKKSATCECEFSCELPVNGSANDGANLQLPNYDYAPLVRKGTLVSNGTVKFEVMSDINFAEQFNEDGISDRIIIPKRNANGVIEKYVIKKLAVVVAGESKVYRKVISDNDITPFMEILLQDNNVLGIESIICKDGVDFKTDPGINDFFIEDEHVTANISNGLTSDTYRFFEVESLADQYRFGDVLDVNGVPETEAVCIPGMECSMNDKGEVSYLVYLVDDKGANAYVRTTVIHRGEWKPLKNKFITEYTDNGLMKIIFGAGYNINNLDNIETKGYDSKNKISRIVNNQYLGMLPPVGYTMFILYRTGGGQESNVAKGAINSLVYSNVVIKGDGSCSTSDIQMISNVKKSLKVTNTTPSIGGKDIPSLDEIKYLIKYNNSSQNRCVTLKDYHERLMRIPAKYGCPFRASVVEENNKIVIYMLYTNFLKNLTGELPTVFMDNLENYLSEYRMINDFIEIKSGRVINLSFEIDMFVSKSYNKADVIKNVIDLVNDYMDIDKRQMGDDIFVGDLEKEISQTDGVISLIDMRVYNEFGDDYSKDQTSQERVTLSSCGYGGENSDSELLEPDRFQIDIRNSDGVLYADVDSMFEIKHPSTDVKIRVKVR